MMGQCSSTGDFTNAAISSGPFGTWISTRPAGASTRRHPSSVASSGGGSTCSRACTATMSVAQPSGSGRSQAGATHSR